MEMQRDLAEIKATADELYTWFIALQDSGFDPMQAYGLLPGLILTGTFRRES
jgi:hypothetical protein